MNCQEQIDALNAATLALANQSAALATMQDNINSAKAALSALPAPDFTTLTPLQSAVTAAAAALAAAAQQG